MVAGFTAWAHAAAVVLLVGLAALGRDPGAAAAAADGGKRQYLLPFMWHGPNNQINEIKETLALAKVLGRTLVLPDLQAHQWTDSVKEPMYFKELFDVSHIKANFDAILLEELPAALGRQDWAGELDAGLLLVPPDQKLDAEGLAVQGLKPPTNGLWLPSPVTAWKGCSQENIEELRRVAAPYDLLGVQTFHGLLYGSQWLAGPMPLACQDACCQAFKDTAPFIRKSEAVYDMAKNFMEERLGEKPYVAAHVRPYPDPCVKLWTQPESPERTKRLTQYCNNDYLLYRFAPSLKYLKDTYRADKVFVMTHPRVRAMVQTLLQKVGIEPLFMELADLKLPTGAAALSTNLTFSLLAMVEEAVCAKAKAFVGTKESSMTATIIQERVSRGLPLTDAFAFFRRPGYEEKPITVTEWYNINNVSLSGSEKWRKKLEHRLQKPEEFKAARSTNQRIRRNEVLSGERLNRGTG